MLYENCFLYNPHFNVIDINDDVNSNSVLVVMCIWKRIHYLKTTLQYLEEQNIDKSITLCIWNNNKNSINEINEIIKNFNGKKVKVIIHHSPENIGGIGRFVLTKYVCEKKCHFQNVIFIDDDQILRPNFIKLLLENKTKKSGFHWYGKKFYKDKLYWDCYKNFRYTKRSDYDYSNFDETILDYGGTCGMIIDTECFLMDSFYNFNRQFQFVEDLWMSYFVTKKLNYKLYNGYDILSKSIDNEWDISNDTNAQWHILKPTKDTFLKVLREDGEWDV